MKAAHVTMASKAIPVLAQGEIVVCGGGPAGVAAAVSAARCGKKVVLLEQTGCLGGMGTVGLVPAIIHMGDGERLLARAICLEVVDEMCRRMGVKPNYGWCHVHPEILKRVYDDIVLKAGVAVWLNAPAVDVVMKKDAVEAVVVGTRQGLKAVPGQVFVDATGDGNISAWAGAPFELGGARGETMSPSLCVQYAGIDWAAYREACGQGKGDRQAWEKLLAEGKAPLPEHHFVGCFKTGETIGSGNLGHIYGVNGIDERDVTRGYVEGRRIAEIIHRFYREHVPGFAKCELVETASLLSVRETRRIKGEYVLCYRDYQAHASFPDEIGRFAYPVDIHSSTTDAEEQKRVLERLKESRLKKGESYGIPYRSLVPLNVKNLLVGGRCFSADREVQSSARVMPGCFITGHGAGVGAALALSAGGEVRAVNVNRLRDILRDQGAYVP